MEMATERYAREDMTIAGVTIPRGEMVFAVLASANRDERQFADPDMLDLTREPNKHLSSGSALTSAWGTAGPPGGTDRDHHTISPSPRSAADSGAGVPRGGVVCCCAAWNRCRWPSAILGAKAGDRAFRRPESAPSGPDLDPRRSKGCPGSQEPNSANGFVSASDMIPPSGSLGNPGVKLCGKPWLGVSNAGGKSRTTGKFLVVTFLGEVQRPGFLRPFRPRESGRQGGAGPIAAA